MKIIVTSLYVDDQDKAVEFYTRKLGFVVKHDLPVGQYRWIALVSSEERDGTELILEPNDHPAAREFQRKLHADGIPVTMFGVDDTQREHQRLTELGVRFTMEPTKAGEHTIAIFDDTCGNLIQIIDYKM